MEEADPLAVDWDIPWKPYPPKVLTLATGEKMVVREAAREEVPLLLDAIRPVISAKGEYFDLVAARTYAELLGWYQHRVRNEYCLIGVVDGNLVGLVNNRLIDSKVCVSLHTIALRIGRRVGAHLFAAKQEHAMETFGVDEILVTAESPRGFGLFALEWGLEFRPSLQHELGGAKCWVLTRDAYFRKKSKLVFGQRPVHDDLYKQSLQPVIIEPDILRDRSD